MAHAVNTLDEERMVWPDLIAIHQRVSGGGRRDRTDDLMLAKHALSQLSYAPVPEELGLNSDWSIVRLRQLACASKGWWAWEDLNFRPHAYQARALTN